jgi:hypothetical protein
MPNTSMLFGRMKNYNLRQKIFWFQDLDYTTNNIIADSEPDMEIEEHSDLKYEITMQGVLWGDKVHADFSETFIDRFKRMYLCI